MSEFKNYDVSEIVSSEVRIILLYCTHGAKAGLNNSNYLWICTQSVVGEDDGTGGEFQDWNVRHPLYTQA